MSMLQSTRNWFQRNRALFVAGTTILGTVYLTAKVLKNKFYELQQSMREECSSRQNLQRRFHQNQEDCTSTVLAFIPNFSQTIYELFSVESLLSELQSRRNAQSVHDNTQFTLQSSQVDAIVSPIAAPHTSQSLIPSDSTNLKILTKRQLWDQLKTESVSRTFTLIYMLCLSTILTRVQLNLLGRRNYLSCVMSSVSAADKKSVSRVRLESLEHSDSDFDKLFSADFDTNRAYLSISWWLMHHGAEKLCHDVTAAVTDVLNEISPRDDISLYQLSQITLQIRKKLEGDSERSRRNKSWVPYLLPPRDMESLTLFESGLILPENPQVTNEPFNTVLATSEMLINPSLRRLLDETADIIDSPMFHTVLTHLLDAAFTHLTHVKLAPTVFGTPPAMDFNFITVDSEESPSAMVKLAACLAGYSREASAIGKTGPEAASMFQDDASLLSESLAMLENLGFPDLDIPLPRRTVSNEYLNVLEQVPELEALAAIVFTSNFEFELASLSPIPGLSSSSFMQNFA